MKTPLRLINWNQPDLIVHSIIKLLQLHNSCGQVSMCDCEVEVIPQCVLWWAARGGGPGSYWAPREPEASVGLLPDHSTTWDHLRPAGSHSRAGWPGTCTGAWRQPVEQKQAFRRIWHCDFWNFIQKYSLPSHHYPYIMSAVQRQRTVNLK